MSVCLSAQVITDARFSGSYVAHGNQVVSMEGKRDREIGDVVLEDIAGRIVGVLKVFDVCSLSLPGCFNLLQLPFGSCKKCNVPGQVLSSCQQDWCVVLASQGQREHACGFAPADQGVDTRLILDYPGRRNIQHTVMYTATNPARF
jgi:hypothetical protein